LGLPAVGPVTAKVPRNWRSFGSPLIGPSGEFKCQNERADMRIEVTGMCSSAGAGLTDFRAGRDEARFANGSDQPKRRDGVGRSAVPYARYREETLESGRARD